MTKEEEEAAEIILSGRTWRKCEYCLHGLYYRGYEGVHCGTCGGFSLVLDSIVYEAYGVLGLPLPPMPDGISWLPSGWNIRELEDLREASYRNKYG